MPRTTSVHTTAARRTGTSHGDRHTRARATSMAATRMQASAMRNILTLSQIASSRSGNARRAYTPADDLFEIGATTKPGQAAAEAIVFVGLRRSGSPSLQYCEFYDGGSSIFELTYTTDGVTYPHGTVDDVSQRFMDGTGRLAYRAIGPDVQCDATWNGETLSSVGTPAAIAPDQVEIYAENVTETVDWFIQIQTD